MPPIAGEWPHLTGPAPRFGSFRPFLAHQNMRTVDLIELTIMCAILCNAIFCATVPFASKGLGKACAKSLADEGARVFVCSRDAEQIKRAAAEMRAIGCSAADVSRPDRA